MLQISVLVIMRRIKKKSEADCQTDIQCMPHILNEGDLAKVQSNKIVQTVASLPAWADDTLIYEQLQRIDPLEIQENAVLIVKYRAQRKLKFLLPDEAEDLNGQSVYTNVSEAFNEMDLQDPEVVSIDSIVECSENMADKKVMTRLMVFPHFLHAQELATITCNFSTQTDVSCQPQGSLTEIIPKLKAYLNHEGREISPGDTRQNRSILDIIRGIIEEVEDSHKHLFDADFTAAFLPANINNLKPLKAQGKSSSSECTVCRSEELEKMLIAIKQGEAPIIESIKKEDNAENYSTIVEIKEIHKIAEETSVEKLVGTEVSSEVEVYSEDLSDITEIQEDITKQTSEQKEVPAEKSSIEDTAAKSSEEDSIIKSVEEISKEDSTEKSSVENASEKNTTEISSVEQVFKEEITEESTKEDSEKETTEKDINTEISSVEQILKGEITEDYTKDDSEGEITGEDITTEIFSVEQISNGGIEEKSTKEDSKEETTGIDTIAEISSVEKSAEKDSFKELLGEETISIDSDIFLRKQKLEEHVDEVEKIIAVIDKEASVDKKNVVCSCGGLKIKLFINNIDDPSKKTQVELNILPGLQKLEVRAIPEKVTKEEPLDQNDCDASCCPSLSLYKTTNECETLTLPDGRVTKCPRIVTRLDKVKTEALNNNEEHDEPKTKTSYEEETTNKDNLNEGGPNELKQTAINEEELSEAKEEPKEATIIKELGEAKEEPNEEEETTTNVELNEVKKDELLDYEDSKNIEENVFKTEYDENTDKKCFEFCQNEAIKKQKSRDLLNTKAVSVSNLLDGAIMALVSKSNEGFNIQLNVKNINQDVCKNEQKIKVKEKIKHMSEDEYETCSEGPSTSRSAKFQAKVKSNEQSRKSSLSMKTGASAVSGVLPFRERNCINLMKSTDSVAVSETFLRKVNPMFTSSSGIFDILTPSMLSHSSFTSQRVLFNEIVQYSAPSTDVSPKNEEINSPKNVEIEAPKSAEKQDIVFMTYKACEELFKPVQATLINLRQRLKNLNMPEIDCIFNKETVVKDVPKYTTFQKKMRELDCQYNFPVIKVHLSSPKSKVTGPTSVKVHPKVTFSYVNPAKAPQMVSRSSNANCCCKPPSSSSIKHNAHMSACSFENSKSNKPKPCCSRKPCLQNNVQKTSRSVNAAYSRINNCCQTETSYKNQATNYSVTPPEPQSAANIKPSRKRIQFCDDAYQTSSSSQATRNCYTDQAVNKVNYEPKCRYEISTRNYDSAYHSNTNSPYTQKTRVKINFSPKTSDGNVHTCKKQSSHSLCPNYSSASIGQEEDDWSSSNVSSHVSSEEFICPAKKEASRRGKKRKYYESEQNQNEREPYPFLEALNYFVSPRKKGKTCKRWHD